MPAKRRRLLTTSRRRRKSKPSPIEMLYPQFFDEKQHEKSQSDLQTIPDQTFGKIYSMPVIEEISSSNASSMIEPDPTDVSTKKQRSGRRIQKRKRI
ncbi:unnamed protein product [Adineta ricciae]|uniref:Uncharacterized protein n=1 Tax=Adineta ricciae TaxID=249248 RepID=A0A814J9X8_ADIRI|nr:unnamed protein product [Adineta ricciae]CAF1057962.1 unnamed protein product [Adineta ricciae]